MKVQKLIDVVEKSKPRKWVYEWYGRRVTTYVMKGVFALVDGSKVIGLETDEKILVRLRVLEVTNYGATRRVSYVIETDPENIRQHWGSNTYDVSVYIPERGFEQVCRLVSDEDKFLSMEHANKIVWAKAYKLSLIHI